MQPIRILTDWLERNASSERYLFSSADLQGLFPELSRDAFKALIARAAKTGRLERICRGIYAYRPARYSQGLLLFHVAARLRAGEFNYISLETALSEQGVISQIPINYITLMSSGRSSVIRCGRFGTIEFVHTTQKPDEVADRLVYDGRYRLWRAHVPLALRDMRATRRSTSDLIDWEAAREFV